MKLSLMEGIANLLFDLFFMGVLDIGVAGAGFGTACANVLRCSATVIYMIRCTDMYKSSKKKVSMREVAKLLEVGVPDSTNGLMLALQSYLIMKIILIAFGTPGGAIKADKKICRWTRNKSKDFIPSCAVWKRWWHTPNRLRKQA